MFSLTGCHHAIRMMFGQDVASGEVLSIVTVIRETVNKKELRSHL
jgi:hypothetical protein